MPLESALLQTTGHRSFNMTRHGFLIAAHQPFMYSSLHIKYVFTRTESRGLSSASLRQGMPVEQNESLEITGFFWPPWLSRGGVLEFVAAQGTRQNHARCSGIAVAHNAPTTRRISMHHESTRTSRGEASRAITKFTSSVDKLSRPRAYLLETVDWTGGRGRKHRGEGLCPRAFTSLITFFAWR